MFPAMVHEILFLGTIAALIWSLCIRKRSLSLALIVGATFIFCYWHHSKLPAQPTTHEYLVFYAVEMLVYLTASFSLVRLHTSGASEIGRVYFFLFVYDLALLIEYKVVISSQLWQTPYAHNSFELITAVAILLINSFVLFGDWYNGSRRRRNLAHRISNLTEPSDRNVAYSAQEGKQKTGL